MLNPLGSVYDDEGDWFEGENQNGQRGTFPRKSGLSAAAVFRWRFSDCVAHYLGTFVRKIGGAQPGAKKAFENTVD